MVDDRRPTLNLVLITLAAQPVDLLHGCYDKDLQTDFYLFTRCTDTGVITTHASSFYRSLTPLFLLTHAQLAVVTQSCALLYITAHCDLLLQ